jgi:hypothetical protein
MAQLLKSCSASVHVLSNDCSYGILNFPLPDGTISPRTITFAQSFSVRSCSQRINEMSGSNGTPEFPSAGLRCKAHTALRSSAPLGYLHSLQEAVLGERIVINISMRRLPLFTDSRPIYIAENLPFLAKPSVILRSH